MRSLCALRSREFKLRIFHYPLLLAMGVAVSACGGGFFSKAVPKSKRAHINNKTKFSQAAYGVAASPRVTTSRVVRKGGGRRQIGRPYKIKGKWYTPNEDFGYDRTGQASWYGPNFHGRLTANGEIYDQYALTAAHPTFPLPSYARVTNLANGRSVIVRVNDRGPYHEGRIIDLSARASALLNYQHLGIANVRVEYIRQAPLHGLDDKVLSASYSDGSNPMPVSLALANQTPQPRRVKFTELTTGSIKKPALTDDPLLAELQAVREQKDTGSTLALRLKKIFKPASSATQKKH